MIVNKIERKSMIIVKCCMLFVLSFLTMLVRQNGDMAVRCPVFIV
jgi:hypothetical protein